MNAAIQPAPLHAADQAAASHSAAEAVLSRAAVFCGGGGVSERDVYVPAPKRGEIRVRLEGCGVCASNLPVWEGRPWFKYPFEAGAPGHEGWGIIDAIGDEVSELTVGDRVAFISGKAYAQYDIAPATSAVAIPEALANRAVPGEPLGCAMNIFRRSDIRAGQIVAIVGIGFLGALLTALSVRAGARVVAFSRRPHALTTAQQFGASHTIGIDDLAKAKHEARRVVGDAGFERVIEAVGNQNALELASELAGERARLVIAGYHQDGPRSIDLQRWNWLGLDVINAHERDPAVYRRGMQEAIDLMAAGELDPTPLYTHHYPLQEIGAAFDALSQRPAGFMKALIDCR